MSIRSCWRKSSAILRPDVAKIASHMPSNCSATPDSSFLPQDHARRSGEDAMVLEKYPAAGVPSYFDLVPRSERQSVKGRRVRRFRSPSRADITKEYCSLECAEQSEHNNQAKRHTKQPKNDWHTNPPRVCCLASTTYLVQPRSLCRGKSAVAKKPKSIVVVEEGDERYILKTFSDGSEEREPVVKLPRKKRYPARPYWHWDLNKGRKKGF